MTRRFAGWEFSTRDAHGSRTWLAPVGFGGSRFSYRVGFLLRLPHGRQLVAFHYRYAKNLERANRPRPADPELVAAFMGLDRKSVVRERVLI